MPVVLQLREDRDHLNLVRLNLNARLSFRDLLLSAQLPALLV